MATDQIDAGAHQKEAPASAQNCKSDHQRSPRFGTGGSVSQLTRLSQLQEQCNAHAVDEAMEHKSSHCQPRQPCRGTGGRVGDMSESRCHDFNVRRILSASPVPKGPVSTAYRHISDEWPLLRSEVAFRVPMALNNAARPWKLAELSSKTSRGDERIVLIEGGLFLYRAGLISRMMVSAAVSRGDAMTTTTEREVTKTGTGMTTRTVWWFLGTFVLG